MNPTVIEALNKIGWPEWHFDTNWGVYRERLRKAKVGWAIDRFDLDFGKWEHHTKLAEAMAIALIEKHLRERLEKRGIWVGMTGRSYYPTSPPLEDGVGMCDERGQRINCQTTYYQVYWDAQPTLGKWETVYLNDCGWGKCSDAHLFADYLHALASAVLAAMLPKLQQEVTDARNSIQS